MVSGFYFLWDSLPFFVRLRATAPLWGGVMLCIMSGCCWLGQLWHHPRHIGVWVGDWLYNLNSFCDITRGNWAPLNVVCNGPTPWQCSQEHLVCSVYWLCNLFFGDSCLCLSLCPKILGSAAPLSGGTTFEMVRMQKNSPYWVHTQYIQGKYHETTSGGLSHSNQTKCWEASIPTVCYLLGNVKKYTVRVKSKKTLKMENFQSIG